MAFLIERMTSPTDKIWKFENKSQYPAREAQKNGSGIGVDLVINCIFADEYVAVDCEVGYIKKHTDAGCQTHAGDDLAQGEEVFQVLA